MAFAAFGERGVATLGTLRAGHVVQHGPTDERLIAEGRLYPDHRRAGLTHRLRETVHVRDDALRVRAIGVRHARHHESVLHVDHEQGGLTRIEVVVHVLLAAMPDDAIDDRLRDVDLVHGSSVLASRHFTSRTRGAYRVDARLMF